MFHKNDTDMTCGILRRVESLWLSRNHIDITISIWTIVLNTYSYFNSYSSNIGMHSKLFSKTYNNDHHVPQKIYTYLTNCFNFTTYCILYTEANALSRHNESMNHVKFCVVPCVSFKPSNKIPYWMEAFKTALFFRVRIYPTISYITTKFFMPHGNADLGLT